MLELLKFQDQEILFVNGNPSAREVAVILGYDNPTEAVKTIVSPQNKIIASLATFQGNQ
jgi:hypothetical protein